MNNLHFANVVLAINSAEHIIAAGKQKKINSAKKHQNLALLNIFFGTIVPLNSAEAEYRLWKKEDY